MGNQNSGNRRTDYRRGRHKADAEITAYNKERVGLVVRIHPELLKKFRILAIEKGTNVTDVITKFIEKEVKKGGCNG